MEDRIPQVRLAAPRRSKIHIGVFDINYLVKRNPWVPAWWSMALPGMGHLHLGMYMKGFILMSGEIFLNTAGHINEAILYTMTLQWDKVNPTINHNWAYIYVLIWVFAIWDSYRLAVDLNKLTLLESRQPGRNMKKMVLSTVGINFLDKRTPWMSVFLSLSFSGLSHICNSKLISGLTMLGWMVAISTYTHYPSLIVYTFTGNFDLLHDAVNYQWLLFFPSIYFFAAYDAYAHAIHSNNLFKEEQREYLTERFGRNGFRLEE
ncbi:hypothetical protein [Gorillibacterium sp. sgz5001074]|uniref:hypothetical protein n=1 Tax=Gorillibacterium sp. sgz5001074 TaxID=3446695 RepID=UPI003F677BA5